MDLDYARIIILSQTLVILCMLEIIRIKETAITLLEQSTLPEVSIHNILIFLEGISDKEARIITSLAGDEIKRRRDENVKPVQEK